MKKPVISPQIELYPFEKGQTSVFHKTTSKTYLLGQKESQVLQCLDGAHTLSEIHSACPFFTKEEITQLLDAFRGIGLLKGSEPKKELILHKVKLPLCNPNRLIRGGSPFSRFCCFLIFFFCPLLFLTGVFLAAGGQLYSLSIPVEKIVREFSHLSLGSIGLILLFSFVSLLLHELAHTLSARRWKVNVPEIGLMVYWLMPCAYTNLSGINLLTSKKQKILILASGSFVNLGLIGLCCLLMAALPPKAGACLFGTAIANLGMICLNAVSFLKFDGYYIAEVLLNELQLREKSFSHLGKTLKSFFRRDEAFEESQKQSASSQLDHLLYLVFALCSAVYLPVFLLNIIIPLFLR